MYINQIIYLFLIQFVKFAKQGTKNLQILCSMDWEFFNEMSVSFMTTSKIITLLSLEMFAYVLSIAHAYTTIVGQKGHICSNVLVVSISI